MTQFLRRYDLEEDEIDRIVFVIAKMLPTTVRDLRKYVGNNWNYVVAFLIKVKKEREAKLCAQRRAFRRCMGECKDDAERREHLASVMTAVHVLKNMCSSESR